MADFPNIPISNITFTNNTPTLITRSLNGREERAQTASQFWSFSASFINLSEANRRELLGFLMSKRGPYSSFTINLPSTLDNTGSGLSGTLTANTATAGATSFTATITANTLCLKAGDLIKFANHSKVYMVTADATSNGAGAVTVNIFPAIKTTASSQVVTYQDVPITVRLGGQEHSFRMAQEMYGSLDLDFIEVI